MVGLVRGDTFRAQTYTLTLYSEVFGDRVQTKTTLGRRTIAELARKCDKMGRKRRKLNPYVAHRACPALTTLTAIVLSESEQTPAPSAADKPTDLEALPASSPSSDPVEMATSTTLGSQPASPSRSSPLPQSLPPSDDA